MTTYLLDINLLLALSDPAHVHHETAHQWFAGKGRLSWATCPLTENGFVRIASHASYPNRPGDVPIVLTLLRQLCASEGHVFWNDDVSIRNILKRDAVIASSHVTDAYLLGLATHNGSKLASLDRRIPVDAVQGGRAAVELIS